MKLYIKQRVFTIGEQFEVKNEMGETVFYCEGSFLRIPKKFIIRDHDYNVVCEVERVFLTFLPRFEISEVGGRSITLRKNLTLFFSSYTLDNIPWKLEGDFFAHNYQLVYGNTIIMSLSKHWFTWGDSYELNVHDDSDAVLALGIVIAIDRAVAEQNNNS